jgi:anti-anti-sigma regulatory factor
MSAELLSMKTPAANLLVWVGDKNACIKIAGRASFNSSLDFKTLVNGLFQKGFSRFVLDLTDCLLMDSTFLGVLAGLGLKFGAARNGNSEPYLELLNANPRILDLLDNLGVCHLFKLVKGPEPATEKMASVEPTPLNPDRKAISRTCLEAHQTLMEINPANIPKFKEVTQFLAEDLKKLEGGEGKTRDDG